MFYFLIVTSRKSSVNHGSLDASQLIVAGIYGRNNLVTSLMRRMIVDQSASHASPNQPTPSPTPVATPKP
jgi:hypothetical protein